MVRYQKSVNDFSTTLNGAITDVATSMTLTSATGLPAEGDFFLDLMGEVVKVTSRSGAVCQIERAQAGTTAAAKGDGSNVTDVIVAEEFENRANERLGLRALPYGRCTRWDGTTLTTVTSSDFTLYNTGSGTAVGDGNDGTIWFSSKDMSGNDVSFAGVTCTGTTDHRITAHIGCPAFDEDAPDILHFATRQNTGGSMRNMELWPRQKIGVRDRTTFLSTGSDVAVHGVGGRNDMWVRLEIEWNVVASTDYFRWYLSKDGVNWWFMHTHTFAASSTAVGIGMTNITGSLAAMRCNIFSWHHEELTF